MSLITSTFSVIFFDSSISILIPIFIQSLKNAQSTPYYLFLISAIFFIIVFFFALILYRIYNQLPLYQTYDQASNYTFIITGIFNALSVILIVYSSDATRLPIVMQSILSGSGIFFSVIASKYLIESKRMLNFYNKYTGLSLGLLLLSIIISTIPQYTIAEWKASDLFWIVIYLLGNASYAIFNTLQERYLELNTLFYYGPVSVNSLLFVY